MRYLSKKLIKIIKMKITTTTTVLALISTLIKSWQLSPLQADRKPTLRLTNTSLLMMFIFFIYFRIALHCICCWSWSCDDVC